MTQVILKIYCCLFFHETETNVIPISHESYWWREATKMIHFYVLFLTLLTPRVHPDYPRVVLKTIRDQIFFMYLCNHQFYESTLISRLVTNHMIDQTRLIFYMYSCYHYFYESTLIFRLAKNRMIDETRSIILHVLLLSLIARD